MKKRSFFMLLIVCSMLLLVGFGDKGYDKSNPDERALMKVESVKKLVKKEGYSIKPESDVFGFGNSDLSFYAVGKEDGNSFIKDEHYAVSHFDNGIYKIEDGNLVAVSGPQYELEQEAIKEIKKIPLLSKSIKSNDSEIRFDRHDLFTRFNSNGRGYNVEGDRFVMETAGKTPRYFWYINTKVADKNFYGVWEEYLLADYTDEVQYWDSVAYSVPDFKQALSQGGKAVDINDYVEARAEVEKAFLEISDVIQEPGYDIILQNKTVKIDKYQYNVFTVEKDSGSSSELYGTYAVNVVLGKIYQVDNKKPKKIKELLYDRGT